MEQIKIVDKNIFLSCIIALAILMLIPFIGMTDFHTKGEPREAVIALDMLKSGNWILPVTAGGVIAYKPPFYHWCLAATSYVCGGVTEFTARFPSSAFAIAMIIMFYLFYARRTSSYQSFLATAILMTSFEVHRAAMNARVDMVLMSLSVMAILKLYMWWEKGLKGIPIIAI